MKFSRTFQQRGARSITEIKVKRYYHPNPIQLDSKAPSVIVFDKKEFIKDDYTNVTNTTLSRVGKLLYKKEHHPLTILKEKIYQNFPNYHKYDNLSPIVNTKANFEDLLFPKDHPGLEKNQSYYFNRNYLLRTHTSCHQLEILQQSKSRKFLILGETFRKDEIDRNHYPVFHQLEGVHTFSPQELYFLTRKLYRKSLNNPRIEQDPHDPPVQAVKLPKQPCHSSMETKLLIIHLKLTLTNLVMSLFGNDPNLKLRWVNAYFPFTCPSFELEIFYRNQWLEILGCGIMRQEILNKAALNQRVGWAFGLGLERLAMALFDISDIRLFWSEDRRFIEQFSNNEIVPFKPFSKYPPCIKDLSFWANDLFDENSFCDIIRDCADDLVEDVRLIDEFVHPKTQRKSLCYRITYRSMDRNVQNEEINVIQQQVREKIVEKFKVELR